jgi:UDP-N-acetylmuramoyl-tripeptide--D-alanyl-D-alanine ligase
MHWSAAAVEAATRGRLVTASLPPDDPGGFGGVGIDSRQICSGALFVPLRAERDGHEYVAAAVRAGAAGYLFEAGRLSDASGARVLDGPGIGIEVADTAAALLELGRAARDRLEVPVVGITGSVGKTSTKDMMARVLRTTWRTAASERSFNNELGVPLTLANAPADTEIAVIEMGARRPGQIALLCGVARPTIAVVTVIAAVHTEMFGSIDAVAQAKGELVEAVEPGGLVVLNADDARVAALAARTRADVLRYSAAGAVVADVTATDVRVGEDLRPNFLLSSPWGSERVTLGVRGAHQIGNALAAATVALQQGVPVAVVTAALAEATLSPWRMELVVAPSGAVVLNDAYNANPGSMAAALRALAVLPARRRVAVVGAMAELGVTGPAEHRAIALLAEELGVDLIPLGTAEYGPTPVAGIDEAVARLGPLGDGDAVLVKASRVVGLERLAARLTAVPT